MKKLIFVLIYFFTIESFSETTILPFLSRLDCESIEESNHKRYLTLFVHEHNSVILLFIDEEKKYVLNFLGFDSDDNHVKVTIQKDKNSASIYGQMSQDDAAGAFILSLDNIHQRESIRPSLLSFKQKIGNLIDDRKDNIKLDDLVCTLTGEDL